MVIYCDTHSWLEHSTQISESGCFVSGYRDRFPETKNACWTDSRPMVTIHEINPSDLIYSKPWIVNSVILISNQPILFPFTRLMQLENRTNEQERGRCWNRTDCWVGQCTLWSSAMGTKHCGSQTTGTGVKNQISGQIFALPLFINCGATKIKGSLFYSANRWHPRLSLQPGY